MFPISSKRDMIQAYTDYMDKEVMFHVCLIACFHVIPTYDTVAGWPRGLIAGLPRTR